MAKIIRKTQYLFAENSPPSSVSAFGSIEAGSPNYSLDPAILQNEPEWGQGWTSTQYEGVRAPYIFDRNSVDLVAFYQLAYILQEGIAEWDAGTTYYTNSIVQYNGQKFISLVDNNLGNIPPNLSSNSIWQIIFFPSNRQLKAPTFTLLQSGSGDYYAPTGCVRLRIRAVGGGGGGWGSGGLGGGGGTTTFQTSGGSYILSAGGAGARTDINGNVYPIGGIAQYADINVNGDVALNFVGFGGNSVFGGAGVGGIQPIPFTGSGGAAEDTVTPFGGGYGGGSGAYCETVLESVNVGYPYPYAIGEGGTGGSGSYPGQNGAGGQIIIDEFYY